MKSIAAAVTLIAIGVAPVSAHHSEAPHYILDRTIELTGKVRSWRQINPHSIMELVVETNGTPTTWRCEANGAAVMQRLGIRPDSFARDATVTVVVNPPRRANNLCNLRLAKFADGRTIDFRGPTHNPGVAEPTHPVPAKLNDSIFGTWTPVAVTVPGANSATQEIPLPAANEPAGTRRPPPGSVRGIGVQNGPQWLALLDAMTPAGKQASAGYDPYRDNPGQRCLPTGRQWNWPLSLTQDGANRIVLRQYQFDTQRVIHLNQGAVPPGTPRSPLGYSIGRWEGDTLLVEVTHFTPGVLYAWVVDATGNFTGILHSDALKVVERIRFDPDKKTLKASWTLEDPKYHAGRLSPGEREFQTAGLPLGRYNCVPEAE